MARLSEALYRATYKLVIGGAGDMPMAILFNWCIKISPDFILLLFITNLIAVTRALGGQ